MVSMSASKLPPFEYYEPTTIAEASGSSRRTATTRACWPAVCDLLPRLRAGSVKAGHVVNIQRVVGLDYMRRTASGGLEFGAMASLHALEMWKDLAHSYPALFDAMHQITSVQTKCMGTAVGNLCVATPASDVAPALTAYDAELFMAGPNGERRLAIADFYPAYGRTALGPGEFVTGVVLPAVPVGHGAAFKNLVRTHADIAKVTVTAAVVLEDGLCKQARIALGSVAPTMFRARAAEALLEAQALTDELILRGGGRRCRRSDAYRRYPLDRRLPEGDRRGAGGAGAAQGGRDGPGRWRDEQAGPHIQRQRPASRRHRHPEHDAGGSAARRARTHGHEGVVPGGGVRRLHRARRWQARSFPAPLSRSPSGTRRS